MTRRQKRLLARLIEPFIGALYSASRLLRRQPWHSPISAPRKIMAVRLDSIGDVLLSEPAIAAIKETFPHARLDVAVSPSGQAVLSGNPNIDSFVLYDAPWHRAWRGAHVRWGREIGLLWPILRRLQKERYDLVFELRGDFRDIIFAASTGGKIIVGSSQRGGHPLLDYDVPVESAAHQVVATLKIAAVGRSHATPRAPRVYLDASCENVAQDLLPEGDRYIALHLGAGFATKCLPVTRFCQAAATLCQSGRERFKGIVIIGGKEDRPLAEQFQAEFPYKAINLTGKLTLRETAAVIQRCTLFIGNDSAPMHLAAAVGTPVVAVFGPSSSEKYHPYGTPYRVLEADLACRPCDYVHCAQGENLCLQSIPTESITEAAWALLDRVGIKR